MANSQSARDTSILATASRMTESEAVSLAEQHIEAFVKAGAPALDGREIGLLARASNDYRQKLEKSPDLAKMAKDALTIGAPMPRAEWGQAKELAGANGRVYLPKILTDYAGKVVMVTQTHVVQQASKNSVVAHDLAKLDKAEELARMNADGQLQGKVLKVAYGSLEGQTEVLTFTQVRAADVNQTARDYAQAHIQSPEARADFLKHVEQMMAAEIQRGRTPASAAAQPARRAQREPERTR